MIKVTIIRARVTDSAVYKLADTLSNNGYRVKLLLWDRQNNTNINCKNCSLKIFNFKAPQDNWKVFFYFPIWWLYEFINLMEDDSDIIHACDLDTLWPAILVKLIKRKKLFYIIYDFYASNIPDIKPYILIKFIRYIIASLEKIGIGYTDILFLVDKNRFEQVKNSDIKRIEYIYNSPQDKFDTNIQKIDVNNIILFYAGSLHESRGIGYVLEALEKLDNVKLIIAGEGSLKNKLLNLSPNLNEKIKYIGQISYEEVIRNELISDILFAFYDPIIPNNKYASPNKLFEAMMCGKPIIMNDGISSAQIVREENCGIIVPYGDVNAIRNAILYLKNNPEIAKQLGQNGRKAYEEKYSWKIMEERLIHIYKNLNKLDEIDEK